jgi:hypothetical protein
MIEPAGPVARRAHRLPHSVKPGPRVLSEATSEKSDIGLSIFSRPISTSRNRVLTCSADASSSECRDAPPLVRASSNEVAARPSLVRQRSSDGPARTPNVRAPSSEGAARTPLVRPPACSAAPRTAFTRMLSSDGAARTPNVRAPSSEGAARRPSLRAPSSEGAARTSLVHTTKPSARCVAVASAEGTKIELPRREAGRSAISGAMRVSSAFVDRQSKAND